MLRNAVYLCLLLPLALLALARPAAAQPASATSLGSALVLSRDEPQGQPMALVEAVLRADPADRPESLVTHLGYALAAVHLTVGTAADRSLFQ